jgi:hypothetical protein
MSLFCHHDREPGEYSLGEKYLICLGLIFTWPIFLPAILLEAHQEKSELKEEMKRQKERA